MWNSDSIQAAHSFCFSKHVSLLHIAEYFVVDVVFEVQPQVVIELRGARNLSDFLKTKVIEVRLAKRENDVNEILSKLCNPGDALVPVRKADHGPGSMQGNIADLTEAF